MSIFAGHDEDFKVNNGCLFTAADVCIDCLVISGLLSMLFNVLTHLNFSVHLSIIYAAYATAFVAYVAYDVVLILIRIYY